MAKGKSSSNKILSEHITVYTLVMLIPGILLLGPIGALWAIFNGLVHFLVDYFTSRLTSKLWAEGKVHDFFVVIGLDQLIHTLTLLISYYYIVRL